VISINRYKRGIVKQHGFPAFNDLSCLHLKASRSANFPAFPIYLAFKPPDFPDFQPLLIFLAFKHSSLLASYLPRFLASSPSSFPAL
jgi:hypothetical protein